MATIPSSPTWSPDVYQIETTDAVLGGPDGVINVQAKQLADRTDYLKQEVEAAGAVANGADAKADSALAQIEGIETAAGSAQTNAAEALAHKQDAQAAQALAEQARNAAQAAQGQASDNAGFAYQAAQTAQLKASEAQSAATASVSAMGKTLTARDDAVAARNESLAAESASESARDAAAASAVQAANEAASAAAAVDAAFAEATAAQGARIGAEAARDAAIIKSGVYPDEVTGRAAVADGVAFKVQGSGDIAAYEYRRVNATTVSTLIATYPSAAAVAANKAKADAAPIITPGKNLLDPSLSTLDVILNNVGGVTASTGWTTSGHIPVNPNTQISVNSQRFCAEYNESKVFIAGTFFDPTTSSQRTFTTNAATKFLRITHFKSSTNVQVEYGSSSTTFEAYKELVKAPDGGPLIASNTENVHPSLVNVVQDIINNRAYGEETYLQKTDSVLETTNLVKAINSGYILNGSGALVAQATWKTTDFIAISESTAYTISVVRYLAFYNSAKVMIGTLTDLSNQANYTVTSPVGAAFMRVTALEGANLTANAGSTITQPVTHVRAFKRTLLPELFAILRGWMRSEAYTVTSPITYNANGRPVSPLNIVWPDGCTGVLSIAYNASGNVSEMTATHILNGVTTTVKQPAITYINGSPSQIPAITIS